MPLTMPMLTKAYVKKVSVIAPAAGGHVLADRVANRTDQRSADFLAVENFRRGVAVLMGHVGGRESVC